MNAGTNGLPPVQGIQVSARPWHPQAPDEADVGSTGSAARPHATGLAAGLEARTLPSRGPGPPGSSTTMWTSFWPAGADVLLLRAFPPPKASTLAPEHGRRESWRRSQSAAGYPLWLWLPPLFPLCLCLGLKNQQTNKHWETRRTQHFRWEKSLENEIFLAPREMSG